MDRLFKSILDINEIKSRLDDDFTDRLSRQRTVIVMIVITFILAAKQFVGDPLSCWCPAQFSKSHIDYTNLICWVGPTYHIPKHEAIPEQDLDYLKTTNRVVSYYRWMPIILLIQACLSYMPCVVWRFLNKRSGINLNDVMEATRPGPKDSAIAMREPGIKFMATRIDKYLLAQREQKRAMCQQCMHTCSRYCCMFGGKKYGNYLTVCFVFTKLLYITNSFGQLYVLDKFLGNNYYSYGIDMMVKFFNGEEEWSALDRFPRETICNFNIRHQGRHHSYIVQCVLAINLFNEKIFLFIWFWFVYVGLMSVYTTLKWIASSMFWPWQRRFVWSLLKAATTDVCGDSPRLETFTKDYLRRDGIFIFKLINMNLGESVSCEVLHILWTQYNPKKLVQDDRPNMKSNLKHFGKHSKHSNVTFRKMDVV